jgi:hypothetical protein
LKKHRRRIHSDAINITNLFLLAINKKTIFAYAYIDPPLKVQDPPSCTCRTSLVQFCRNFIDIEHEWQYQELGISEIKKGLNFRPALRLPDPPLTTFLPRAFYTDHLLFPNADLLKSYRYILPFPDRPYGNRHVQTHREQVKVLRPKSRHIDVHRQSH